jgi:putative Mg2+ transporter-C (MgtC) family protein
MMVIFAWVVELLYNLTMQQFFTQNSEIILKLTVSLSLGMFIGAERLFVHKVAGMKTHSLVAMGATLFIIISEFLSQKYAGVSGFNPGMIAANIIMGVGFLSAGLIMMQGEKLMGLTTAGGLWVTAGVGVAVGFGLYSLATISTVLILIIFILMNIIEKPIRRMADGNMSKES